MTYFPERKVFLERAKQGNLVPVWQELLADELTPVSAYEGLRRIGREPGRLPGSFLLESVEGGEHIARFSFLGAMPRAIFRARGRTVEFETVAGVQRKDDADPIETLREYMSQFRAVPDPALPRFFGGAVGYVGYDAVTHFERVPLARETPLDWPDMIFAIADVLLIFDRVRHTVKIVANALVEGDPNAAYDGAVQRIERICEALATPRPHRLLEPGKPAPALPIRSNMTPEEFRSAVLRAKEYIRAGDIIQVVLSQRFSVPLPFDALAVYRSIRSINPSPYMYCLEYADRAIVGSSPEIHVRCENGLAEIRPIAGTRPRAEDPAEDERLAAELLADPKECAEHIMLVDLARNDLGRVCRYGSVRVPELKVIERYSHVMHIVSHVEGQLAPEHDVYDLFRATFPAGTVTGAPKIRAMEIIAELERDRRGPYAGAVGYFSFTGNVDSCITIRTALLDAQGAHVQAGAGIVADSDPEREFEETCNKARGMLQALARAQHYAMP